MDVGQNSFPEVDVMLPGAVEALREPTHMDLHALQFEQEAALGKAEAEEQRRQRELTQKLSTKFDWFKRERETYYNPVWDACYKKYRLQTPDERKSGEWRSKINVPIAYISVEDAVPLLMEGLWGASQPFKLQGAGEHSAVDAHERLLLWEAQELMSLEKTWELKQRQKCIYGTGILYVGFRSDYREARQWTIAPDPSGGTQGDPGQPGVPVLSKKSIPEYVGPTAEVVDLYNIYPHPRSTPDKLQECFWRQYMTMAQMKKSGRFKNLDKVTSSMSEGGNAQDGNAPERRYRTGSMNSDNSASGEPVYQILTFYDDLNKTVVSFTYIGRVLLEETEYPFFHDKMPLIFDRYTTHPFEFWGTGVLEPGLALMDEINAIRNRRADNENLTSNAMLEVREGDIDDEQEDLIVGPGMVLHSRSGDAARWITPPAMSGDSYASEATAARDLSRVTGLGGPVSGQADDKVTSASGTQMLAQAQLLRLKRAIKSSADALKEVVSQMLALNVQFLPLPEVFRVLGAMHIQDYAVLDQSDVVLRATVRVLPAGAYQDPAIERQQATNLANIVGANPTFSAMTDQQKLLEWVYRVHGIQDPSQLLNKPKGMDLFQSMWAFEENMHMSQGVQVPPAGPDDDHDLHLQIHRGLIELRPDLWQMVGQHMVSHDLMKQQQLQLQAQQQLMAANGQAMPEGGRSGDNGPGSAPAGSKGGVGLNPRRQSQPTSGDAGAKMKARMAPRLN